MTVNISDTSRDSWLRFLKNNIKLYDGRSMIAGTITPVLTGLYTTEEMYNHLYGGNHPDYYKDIK